VLVHSTFPTTKWSSIVIPVLASSWTNPGFSSYDFQRIASGSIFFYFPFFQYQDSVPVLVLGDLRFWLQIFKNSEKPFNFFN